MKQSLLSTLFTGLFLLAFLGLQGQAALNIGGKLFFSEYRALQHGEALPAKFIADYDLIKKGDVWYLGVLAMVDTDVLDASGLDRLGVINDTRLNDLWTLRVPVEKTEMLLMEPGVKYVEIAEPVSPYLRASTIDSRTDSVNRGLGLSRAYTGKGVIIGIIDWGFDYTHPMFYDTTITNLRLSRAWDQNKLSGPAPAGYSFGTEYVGAEQLLAAQEDTLYVFGPGSHGTHVGGIAGGGGAGTVHKGAAPESELIFISLRRDAPSLIDAFSYITNYAASVGKPYVVNMSFGSHLGPHDGSSLKNYGIDILNGPGKIFVGSAGNNGNAPFHLDFDFTQQPGDTVVSVVGFGNYDDMFGQTLSMWGSAFSTFGASIIVADGTNQILYESPFYFSNEGHSINQTIPIGTQHEVQIIMESVGQHFMNDKPNIRFEIRKSNSAHKIVLRITSHNSHVHVWNNTRLNSRYTNWGQPFLTNFAGAVAGNILYGVGEPGGVGKNVISVGSYLKSDVNILGQVTGGQMSAFTSSGPTVDGRVKPDISSTGQNVISSVNSFDPTQSGFSTTVEHNGKTYGFRAFSGTSMSGPMVAGIVALMLEANPLLSATQAKAILKETARLDQFTGQIGPEGHLQWGWGKANALAAVLAAKALTNTNELHFINNMALVYPNPASTSVQIEVGEHALKSAELYDLNGKLLKSLGFMNAGDQMTMDINDLPAGTYLIRFIGENSVGFSKLQIVR